MVDNIRLAEKSLGSGKLKISKSSKKILIVGDLFMSQD